VPSALPLYSKKGFLQTFEEKKIIYISKDPEWSKTYVFYKRIKVLKEKYFMKYQE